MPAATESAFKVVQQFQLDYAPVNLTQYESTRTGMRCVVVDQAGPKVNGYFALATEIHDDSGAPHTLEHLVFLGSRSYHYKGLLDKLATRAYSTTNAWTATDQTAYTLSTAGWDGFAQILPVYLEHLILPTLTDSGCYTEVHHIDGTGHDAGVVYSEMQGVQNTASSLIYEKSKQMMYPEGNGFRYETGGKMEALRVLTADRIRAFHKEMYQPRNLCLVITGDVDHQDMLRILDAFEDTLIGSVPRLDDPFKRPWSETKTTLKENHLEVVQFPEEDESVGEVLVSWQGPSCNDDINSAAMEVLLIYLAGSSVSVLENTLVEKEQIASGVIYESDFKPHVVYSFTLTAVETEKLRDAEQRLHTLLADVASKELDLGYMRDCISRFKRQIMIKCEEAGDFFSEAIIVDHLYGDRDGKHLRQMQTMKELDDIEAWDDTTWRAFLKKWLVDNPHVTVLGTPSAELSMKLKKEEEKRLAERLKQLGDAGLKDLEHKLDEAKSANDKPIPDEVLDQFPVPGTESIHFITTTSAGAGTAARFDNDVQKLVDTPSNMFLHFEHIPSNFVRLKITLGASTVPTELKPLIALYLMNFFTTPVMVEGKRIEFEDLVPELERDTIAYAITTESGNAEMLAIGIDLEPESYPKVVEWLRIVLFDAIHDPQRLHASLTKILADIPDEKRSGRSMLAAVSLMTQYKPDSALRAQCTLTKALYLKRIKKRLESNPEEVIDMFTRLCKAINRPENMRVKIAADIKKLKDPVSTWNRLSKGASGKPEAIPRRRDLLSVLAKPGSYSYVVPIAAIDSSFAMFVGKGLDSYEHPDLPALSVAIAFMDSVEGPMWTAVRGQGFAYGSWFQRSTDPGLLSFNIYRSGNAFKAYNAAKTQVEAYAGEKPIDKYALEGAVSSIVLEMADEQPTMAHAAEASYVNQVIRNVAKDWSHKMLAKVRDVKVEDVKAAIRKYMLPIFDASGANLVITCSKTMVDGLVADFGKVGFHVEAKPLEEFYDSYGLANGNDDQEDDDEDEAEDDEDDEGADGESFASENE